MAVPPRNVRLDPYRTPVFCAEDGCGHQLTPGFPRLQNCPWCGGRKRRYEMGFGASLTTQGRLTATREFYEKRPRYLAFAVGLVVVSTLVTVLAFIVGGAAWGMGSVIIGTLLNLAEFALPTWRTHVRDTREIT